MRTALFWVTAHREMAISYRHFGTTSIPQFRYKITTTRCVIIQKSAFVIYSAAEALFPAVKVYS